MKVGAGIYNEPKLDKAKTALQGQGGAEIARGSSRVAYRIKVEKEQFKGGTGDLEVIDGFVDTVIKMAMNANGVAQNKEEIKVYSKFKNNPLLLPIIDNSINNSISISLADGKKHPKGEAWWVQMPYATQILDVNKFDEEFKKTFGSLFQAAQAEWPDEFKRYGFAHFTLRPSTFDLIRKLAPSKYISEDQYENLRFLFQLIDGRALKVADLSRPQNWGFYKGKMVILDYGFTDESAKGYSDMHNVYAIVDEEGDIVLNSEKVRR